MRFFYFVTEPMAGVTPDLPVLRDTDGYIYVRMAFPSLVLAIGAHRGLRAPRSRQGRARPRALRALTYAYDYASVAL